MKHEVRVVELPTKEVFVDVNDLIMEFFSKMESSGNEIEKKVYRDLIARLTSVRDRAHKVGSHEHTQKF